MTLTTHAVVGAAISSALRLNPGAALLAGFMSHFLLDRLPHWDYKLDSAKIDEKNPLNDDIPVNKKAIRDWVKISFDILLGPCLVLIFFMSNGQTDWESLLAGAFGGMLPDGLKFIFMKFRREPLKLFYRFHHLMHSSLKTKDVFWGPCLQAIILLLALILGNWSFFI